MRFFNIDQHISVIADMKKIFNDLGHTIDDKCLSGHAFVMNRKPDNIPMLDGENWRGFDEREGWDEFYSTYGKELEQYDGFICCYPPIFSMLYTLFNKPIIMNIPIRYDYSLENHPKRLERFNTFIRNAVKAGKLFLVANNKFDQKYCETFTGEKVVHIPSLCEYFTYKYSPNTDFSLYYSRENISELSDFAIKKESVLHAGYSWNDICKFKGVVHFPYQVSTMSIFEQYTANIPLFVPSKEFMLELYRKDYSVLWHYSPFLLANGRNGKKSLVPFSSEYDPNDYENLNAVEYWLQFADYYDNTWMQHIIQFKSYDHLRSLQQKTIDFNRVSEEMRIHNIERKRQVYKLWKSLMNEVADNVYN